MPGNRELFAAVKKTPSLVPLPVINLRLANWRDQLAECVAAKVSAIKLLPNFHNYSLKDRVVRDFMVALGESKLRLVIHMRFNDERHRYFALNIKGVTLADLKVFLKRYPKEHVLLTSIYRPELKELAKTRSNFSADIAFCEWIDTIEDLLKSVPANRLMLGTGSPLLSTQGGVNKLQFAKIPAKKKELIGSTNATRFFSL